MLANMFPDYGHERAKGRKALTAGGWGLIDLGTISFPRGV